MNKKAICIILAALSVICAGCGAGGRAYVSAEETGKNGAESMAEDAGKSGAELMVEETGKSGAESMAEDAGKGENESQIAAETEADGMAQGAEPEDVEGQFYVSMIPDDVFESMKGKTYKDYCTIPREDLRYVHVLHKNIDGEILEGEMVCHEMIADDLLEILRELYEQSYPIEKMHLMDVYDADDETGMTDNNSSCFNYRTISHTNRISKHGLGVAVDINTLYNPYTKVVDGERIIEPAAGAPYLDRNADFPYKIVEGDLCWQLFTEHGFEWGGAWTDRKDYQHFELPDSVTDRLRAKYE